ncbi:hypothetical protein NLI96_g9997 [Meripilus lineatus]|uniref:Uncharacterized protein n=1 Tax=Meripilus lineatus TaxID=2056292 RepID=A0AAD5UUR5_9APHY|nr:hypothetical protein NLI96_g9997 [Physisporinus lineatus]
MPRHQLSPGHTPASSSDYPHQRRRSVTGSSSSNVPEFSVTAPHSSHPPPPPPPQGSQLSTSPRSPSGMGPSYGPPPPPSRSYSGRTPHRASGAGAPSEEHGGSGNLRR